MECFGTVYIQCRDAAQCERIAFYLDGKTRPDFPDEVPAHEAGWVEVFEGVATPVRLRRFDTITLVADFDEFEDFDAAESLAGALARLGPHAIYLFFANDEETRHYYRYAGGELRFLLSELPLDGEDDARLNRNVPPALKASIERFDDPAEGLHLLAQYFGS